MRAQQDRASRSASPGFAYSDVGRRAIRARSAGRAPKRGRCRRARARRSSACRRSAPPEAAASTAYSRTMRSRASASAFWITADVRQDLLAEQPDLLVAVFAPQLEHHVSASGVLVLLDRGDAVGGRSGDRLALVEQRVRDLRLRRQPPALLHRLGDRADLVLLDRRAVRAACRPSPGCSAPCWRGTCRRSRARRRGPWPRSVSWIEATTVQPMSMSAFDVARVCSGRTRAS